MRMKPEEIQILALSYLRARLPTLPVKCNFHETIASGVVLLQLLNLLRFPDCYKESRYTRDDRGFVIFKEKSGKKRISASRDDFLQEFYLSSATTPLIFEISSSPFIYAFCENLSEFYGYCLLVDMPKQLMYAPLDVVDGEPEALEGIAMLLRIIEEDFTVSEETLKPITPNSSEHPVDELGCFDCLLPCFHFEIGIFCLDTSLKRRFLDLLIGSEEGELKFSLDYCSIELDFSTLDEEEVIFYVFDYQNPELLRSAFKHTRCVTCKEHKTIVFVGVNAGKRISGMELDVVEKEVLALKNQFHLVELVNVDFLTGFGIVKLLSGLEELIECK